MLPIVPAAGTELTRQAELIDVVRQQGTSMLDTLRGAWAGPDVESFAASWSTVERSVGEASTAVRVFAQEAHRNADDQVAASGGAGAPASGGGGPSGSQRSEGPRWDDPKDEVYGEVDPEIVAAWASMSDEERDAVLDQIIAAEARRYGIDPPDIYYDTSMASNEYGYWDDGTLALNPDLLDDPQLAINTIVHEMRHAGQHKMIDDADTFWWWEDPVYHEGTTPEQVEAWKDNFDDYKSTDDGDTFEEYWDQPVEVDARQHSRDYVNGMTPKDLQDLRDAAAAAQPDPTVPQPTTTPGLPGPPQDPPTPSPSPGPSPAPPGPSPTPSPTTTPSVTPSVVPSSGAAPTRRR